MDEMVLSGLMNKWITRIMKGKQYLVTGGAGCVGSNLSQKLSELNAEKVIILDNLISAYEWNIPQAENIQFVKGDILNDEILKEFSKKNQTIYSI